MLLVALATLVYANSLSGVFFFDDANAIEGNPVLRGLWPLTRFLSAPAESPANGRPLASLTFALSYAAGGLDPFAFRFGNLLVHAAAGVALFLALRAAFEAPRMPAELARHGRGLALATAAIWVAHPLHSECVNYVSQRTEALMGLSAFACFHAALRARQRPGWGVVAVAWCLAGMLSKEIMIVLPPLLLLFDRAFVDGSLREALRARWRLYLALTATALVVVWLMASRPRTATVGLHLGLSAWDWALNQVGMIRTYLELLVWPATLVADYGMPRQLALADVWPDAVLVCGLVLAAVIGLWRLPRASLPLVWFLAVLAPTSSFIPIVTEVGAERRVYAADPALLAAAVACGWLLLARLSRRAAPRTACAAALLLVAALGTRTVLRNTDYHTDASIWGSVVDAVPDNGRAHLNLAYALHGEERLDEALAHYETALRLETSPLDGFHRGNANFNVGLILRERGELDEAVKSFRRAVRFRPQLASAHEELGRTLLAAGRFEKAVAALERVLALDPDDAEAALLLGDAHAGAGRPGAARAAWRKVLSLAPGAPVAAEARERLGE